MPEKVMLANKEYMVYDDAYYPVIKECHFEEIRGGYKKEIMSGGAGLNTNYKNAKTYIWKEFKKVYKSKVKISQRKQKRLLRTDAVRLNITRTFR